MAKSLSPNERAAASRPYPYPPRPILLRLCGLPINTSEEDYLKVWYKEVVPLTLMDDSEYRDHLIRKITTDENVSPVEAEKRFRKRYPLLYRAILAQEEEAANSRDGNAFHRKWRPGASTQSPASRTTRSAKQVRAEYLEAVNDMMARHELTRERAQERLLQTEKGRRLWDEWQQAGASEAVASNTTAGDSQKKEAGKERFLEAVNELMNAGLPRAKAEQSVLNTAKGQKAYQDWLG